MALGDFDSALDALIQWIKTTQVSVDTIPVSRGDKKSLDFELARLKVREQIDDKIRKVVTYLYPFISF